MKEWIPVFSQTVLACWALPFMLRLFRRKKWVFPNYRGEEIPVGLGWFVWLMATAYWLILYLADAPMALRILPDIGGYWLALTGILLLGWLDDRFGGGDVKGIRGHLAVFFREGKVTTGFVKLTGILGLALWVAQGTSQGTGMWMVQGAFLCAAANFVNLLDLRPGRAMKGYFLLTGLALLFVRDAVTWHVLISVWIPVLMLFPADLKGKAMLGDAGSNFLGFSAGICLMRSLPLPLLAGVLFGLLLIHWIAERDSLSRIIEKHRLLHMLDKLGR